MTEQKASAGRRILLVDDDDNVRRLVGKVLEPYGYVVTGVPNGKEALEKLLENKPDLILLDYVLPDMDGLLLLELIRARLGANHTPIICLTGKTDIPTKTKALETGAIDYVTKPFDVRELAARVGTQIRLKDQQEAEAGEKERLAAVAKRAQEEAEQRYRALVQNSQCLVCELNRDLEIVYGSPNHKDILEYDPAVLMGQSWLNFVHPDDRKQSELTLRRTLADGITHTTVVRFRNRLNQWRWLDVSGSLLNRGDETVDILLVSRDITESKETEARLEHMALNDPLTELGNRERFSQELAEVLADSSRSGRDVLVLIDIDDFKLVNDTKGHLVGDNALRWLAANLRAVFGDRHSICRLGGDEFCVILRDSSASEALKLGTQLIEKIRRESQGFAGAGITLSIGLATIEPDISHEELLFRADSVLYAAKLAGKNRCVLYRTDSEELSSIRSEAEWFGQLKRGFAQERFYLFYQPIVDLKTGQRFCSEALIRYLDESGVWHLPAEFLPAAERFHLMNELDQFVLRRVLSEYADERRGRVSINMSGQSVSNPNTVDFIASCLRRLNIDPRRIIFEITETVFMKNLGKACEVVNEIRALGCTFSLDDFGSGFSSLRYLRSLPVDIVKIDGSFVKNIRSDRIDLTLLQSMNEIAHLLGKRTVGEFVESGEMSRSLKELGVDYGQGYYFGAPAPLNKTNSYEEWSDVGWS
jgi:diguanylate cyclase (GGDEF)-like protein/PAS domain S-box-containing protein